MHVSALLALSLALATDATAVASTRGLGRARPKAQHYAWVALFFGGSQAIMPALGGLLGGGIAGVLGHRLASLTSWIAAVLLALIGGKMLWESRGPEDTEERTPGDPFALRTLFLLAIATSIDAFAAGVSLPLLGAPLVISTATIGVVTALCSMCGLYLGARLRPLLGIPLERVGGIVLLLLAGYTLWK